jgi:hypothetical protein
VDEAVRGLDGAALAAAPVPYGEEVAPRHLDDRGRVDVLVLGRQDEPCLEAGRRGEERRGQGEGDGDAGRPDACSRPIPGQ